jgi:hypothetical protein
MVHVLPTFSVLSGSLLGLCGLLCPAEDENVTFGPKYIRAGMTPLHFLFPKATNGDTNIKG